LAKPSKWKLEIEQMMACNCNWGCPCNFQSPPSYGTCEAALAYHVVRGKYNNVTLDGLKWILVASWPGPLHERNGRGIVFLDNEANEEQIRALEEIATGRAGGPIGIFMSTVTAGLDVRRGAIRFHAAGKKSRFSVSGREHVKVEFGPIPNPVTKKEHIASALLPTGMLTKRKDFYSAEVFSVNAGSFHFEYPGRNGDLFRHDWHGP